MSSQKAVGDGRSKTNERVNGDVVNASLNMKLQIISLIAVYLPLIHDDADFLWQPPRDSPELLGLRAVDCCIEH